MSGMIGRRKKKEGVQAEKIVLLNIYTYQPKD